MHVHPCASPALETGRLLHCTLAYKLLSCFMRRNLALSQLLLVRLLLQLLLRSLPDQTRCRVSVELRHTFSLLRFNACLRFLPPRPTGFHVGCAGLERERVPRGKWFCPRCRGCVSILTKIVAAYETAIATGAKGAGASPQGGMEGGKTYRFFKEDGRVKVEASRLEVRLES